MKHLDHSPSPWKRRASKTHGSAIFDANNNCVVSLNSGLGVNVSDADSALILSAPELLLRTQRQCAWTPDENDGSYDAACGEKHLFIAGDIADNSYKFCPYCGGGLAVAVTAAEA